MATEMSMHAASIGKMAATRTVEIDPSCCASCRGMLPVTRQGSGAGIRGEAGGGRGGERTAPDISQAWPTPVDSGCVAGTSGAQATRTGRVQSEGRASWSDSD